LRVRQTAGRSRRFGKKRFARSGSLFWQPRLIQTILAVGENRSQDFLAIVQVSLEIVAMPAPLEDHGLPLVQLKERRRDLIVALMGQHGPISEQQIAEIASIQSAITAFEAVLDDLDAEAEDALRAA
jgi:hypothetical protein